MAAKHKPRAIDSTLVWERPEPANRPAPGPLSRDRIVHAAIAIADKDGLASVSLRKVGAALDAGPMRLYGYLATKEELLELMVDSVYKEMAAEGPMGGDWRDALRMMAHRTRRAARRHTWFIDLLGGRPHLGPNSLAYFEASLAALTGTPGFENIDTVMQAVGTVNAYVVGTISSEASEVRAERESGMNEKEWQNAIWPYLQRMVASGQFPTLARVVRQGTKPTPDMAFDSGLECVLDGVAAQLTPRTPAPAPLVQVS